MGAQHFGDVQDQIGCGHALAQFPGQVHAHDFRRQKIDRLAEHSGFGFDSAHAPADYAKPVDHGRVRIGSDQRVGIINFAIVDLRVLHTLGEIFEIDLVNDPDARRNQLKRFECLLAPLQKLVALAVALEFHFQIQLQRFGRPEEIDLD